MRVRVNERTLELPEGTRLAEVRRRALPGADVVVLNGFPVHGDRELQDGDRVVLIRRGRVPPREELEAALTARHSPGVAERLRAASVGIAGAGGLGSTVALALARTGVGRLVVADHDVVEPSNLNRQQYRLADLGRPKVEALAEAVEEITPLCRVEPVRAALGSGNTAAVFRDTELLVEALDRPEAKAEVVTAYLEAFPDRPVVAASGLAGLGAGGEIRVRRAGRRLWLVGDGESGAAPGVGLMAPRVGLAAHLQALVAVRLLLGLEDGEMEVSHGG